MRNIKTTLLLAILLAFVIDCSKLKIKKQFPEDAPQEHHDKLEELIKHVEGSLEQEAFVDVCAHVSAKADSNADGHFDAEEINKALGGVCLETGVLGPEVKDCADHLSAELDVEATTVVETNEEFCAGLHEALEIRLTKLHDINNDAQEKELWLYTHAHAEVQRILDAKDDFFSTLWSEFTKELRNQFNELDVNGDGKIDMEEGKDALLEEAKSLGIDAEVALSLAVSADFNKDGGLQWFEFINLVVKALTHARTSLKAKIEVARHELCLRDNNGDESACGSVEAGVEVEASAKGNATVFAKSRKSRKVRKSNKSKATKVRKARKVTKN